MVTGVIFIHADKTNFQTFLNLRNWCGKTLMRYDSMPYLAILDDLEAKSSFISLYPSPSSPNPNLPSYLLHMRFGVQFEFFKLGVVREKSEDTFGILFFLLNEVHLEKIEVQQVPPILKPTQAWVIEFRQTILNIKILNR